MKKVISLTLAVLTLLGTLITVHAAGTGFSDVAETRWSYPYINYTVEQGLMNGVGDGKFDPAGTMTRGMVVTVLYRMENEPAVEFENAFSDVKAGAWYANAVIWAKNGGVVNGVGGGRFDPGGKITREQLSTMLYRYAEYAGKNVSASGDLSAFPDRDRAHDYALNALIWATSSGLIVGVKTGDKDLLDPRG
ncbi:MAG: S-layer homology domain-containing protein, partial [Clostridia bacterium]|nr:S-layer homology domain-containing protein [Clostridia bacterium]